MAYLPCDKCGALTDHMGSWDTPIRILCKECSIKSRNNQLDINSNMNNEKHADTFFTQTNCDRCGAPLVSRIMSWFTDEIICSDCSDKEFQIRKDLPGGGREYEGCGYIPNKEN